MILKLTTSKTQRLIVGFVCLFLVQTSSLRADDIDFERDILPIFKENCFDCHGPDEQESEFRVDSRVALLKGGDLGEPAIVPGDISKSVLITAITYEDSDLAAVSCIRPGFRPPELRSPAFSPPKACLPTTTM